MEKCKVAETRRKMEFAKSSASVKVNIPILEKIITLRHKAAQLLGYKNHADFQLIVKMAKDSKTVFDFLNGELCKYKV